MIIMKNGELVPEPLLTALEADEKLKTIFLHMRSCCQKEYVAHIVEAKKAATKQRRLKMVLAQIGKYAEEHK